MGPPYEGLIRRVYAFTTIYISLPPPPPPPPGRKKTFYLWLYAVGHMVKDHLDSERGNPLSPLHGLQFSISRSFICTSVHTTAFVTTFMEQWVHYQGLICRLMEGDFLSDTLSRSYVSRLSKLEDRDNIVYKVRGIFSCLHSKHCNKSL